MGIEPQSEKIVTKMAAEAPTLEKGGGVLRLERERLLVAPGIGAQ
jgi:hypothetical protein